MIKIKSPLDDKVFDDMPEPKWRQKGQTMRFPVFAKINGKTAGRDLLENNIPDNEKLSQVIRKMFYNIRTDELDEMFRVNRLGAIELFNTNDQEIGFTLDLRDDYFKLAIGISPVYQYEKLLIIIIEKDIEKSRVITGVARGPYGSGIQSNEKLYTQYKRGKYLDFIDRWHPLLIEAIKRSHHAGQHETNHHLNMHQHNIFWSHVGAIDEAR